MRIRVINVVCSVAAVLFAHSALAETAQEKAAFALNTSAEQVTVTDIKKTEMKVSFRAHYQGGVYNCYYTHAAGFKSGALCSGPVNKTSTVKPHSGVGCNDLLRAAGRCQ